MYFAALLSILCVALAIAWCGFWVAHQIARLTQATHKATQTMTETPRAHLSKLGDQLDALRESVREVDTKVESALSLGRSNRAKIRNMRFGNDEAAPPEVADKAPVNGAIALPGRDS